VETGKLIRNFTGHTGEIAALDWNAPKHVIATASWDSSIKVCLQALTVFMLNVLLVVVGHEQWEGSEYVERAQWEGACTAELGECRGEWRTGQAAKALGHSPEISYLALHTDCVLY
jgi:WD40 repeat protein